MEPTPAASYADDPDIVELPSSTWSSSNQKRKRTKVPNEIIDVDNDNDSDEVMLIEGASSNCKNKQPMVFNSGWGKHIKDALSNNHVGSSTFHIAEDVTLDILNGPKLGSLDVNFLHGYGSFDDYEYDNDYLDVLEELAESDYNFNLASKYDGMHLPPTVEVTEPWRQKPAAERPSMSQPKNVVTDAIDMKYKSFKQFDTVQGDYDHYFSKPGHIKGVKAVKTPSKDWAKTIQHEWKLLEKDLPEMIYVRVYEDRMDLLRAVIIGPAGTPYHDGLFFFDAYFPPNYPHSPPLVHYHSGGLRLNPNLYACGKVCLSLLGTWSGTGCEKWDASKSTMLQILVSIQALVLNAKPYFNEPGYAHTAGQSHGEQCSLLYNEETFLLSCKTMLYSLHKPPKYFEDFVAGHFRDKGHAILVACRAYLDGAQVGCLVGEGVQDVDEGDKSCSANFRNSLKVLFGDLLMEFTVKGADCDKFLASNAKGGAGPAADTTLKL